MSYWTQNAPAARRAALRTVHLHSHHKSVASLAGRRLTTTSTTVPFAWQQTQQHHEWKPYTAAHSRFPNVSSFASRAFDHCTTATRSYSSPASSGNPGLKEEETTVPPSYLLPHPIWPNEYVDAVEVTHVPPKTLTDKLAYNTVKLFRFNFDWMSGYMFGKMTETKWLNRIVFLETVAGVPGFVAGMLRHLHSLRRMHRDYGWIHTLVEEAENERIHLLTALQLRQPGPAFKAAVWLTQGIFTNWFFLTYLVYPTYCHRFVGYLEEEAVRTYTKALREIDTPGGSLSHWATTPAPDVARSYWKLSSTATMRDVVAVIRADEAHHRDVNHTLTELDTGKTNPFLPGRHEKHDFDSTAPPRAKQ